MKKVQKSLNVAILLSEGSHVFCCVLPTVFSIVSLLAGLGMVSAMPLWLEEVHALIHDWEVTIIAFSAVLITMGWALHVYSQKIDCHDTGCSHGPCEPTKTKTNKLLIIATILFFINVAVYLGIHRTMEVGALQATPHHHHDHEH